MAIVCDKCKLVNVMVNGEICDSCIKNEKESKIDKSYRNNIYLPDELFSRFKQLNDDVLNERKDSKKAFSKFLNIFKTSFINKENGKEINDPTPMVIIPKERTLDRIQNILNHNLNMYAKLNEVDTIEDLEDWNVSDALSDNWEETLYQFVDNVKIMDEDLEHDTPNPEPNIDERLDNNPEINPEINPE